MTVSFDFTGRTAIVTGASKGIGRRIAERLRDAGAEVHNWDIEEHDCPGVMFHRVDVTDAASIQLALSRITDQSGRVDILVNNAGIVGASKPVLEFASDEWRRIVEINLFGVFEVSRLVVPIMRDRGYGRIVNMASLAGKEGTPNLSAYSAAKAGVIAFTKSLAKELATTDIRVNAIAPGAVETEILKQMSDETVAIMLAKTPIQRFGTVDEVADLALFLCSEECVLNVGVAFDASGGRATY